MTVAVATGFSLFIAWRKPEFADGGAPHPGGHLTSTAGSACFHPALFVCRVRSTQLDT
jgi:hypothetical protein